MPEVEEIMKETKTENKDLSIFIEKFVELSDKDAKKMRKELQELKSIKIKDENIVKIIDFLPEDSLDLNKIFVDVSLDEDEKNKILDIVKQYK